MIRKILWSWDTKNPLLALAIMIALVWVFLNVAHFAVLVSSDRVAELKAAIGREVTLDLNDGARIRGRLVSSQWCFRGGVIRWCNGVRVGTGEGEVSEQAFFAWQLPRTKVVQSPAP